MFEITAYRTARIKAEACHGAATHWVELTIVEPQRRGPPHESSVTVHFEDGPYAASQVDAYANAINAVDMQFHPADVAKELADA